MNPRRRRRTCCRSSPARAVLYDEPLKLNALRNDLIFYPVPFDKIVAEVCKDAKLRRLVKNMIYDGVLVEAAQRRPGARWSTRSQRSSGKKLKAIELNMAALKAGFEVRRSSTCRSSDPYCVERMNKTAGMILVEGNAAAALGCMFAGVTVVAWYPITPSSSLPETLIGYMKKYRMDKATGKATFAIVQAEDEIAAIGMVDRRGLGRRAGDDVDVGPGHLADGGVRRASRTTPRCPGVVFDIQRVGPSTGLPTRTAQGDILLAAMLSHGDTKQIMLLPASVEECYTMAMDAFDLAERFQTLVFVMSDLDLGMNTWMSQPFTYPGEAARSRQGARRGEAGAARASGAATRTSTATAFRTGRIPGDGMPAVLHARFRPQRARASTASGRTTTSRTSIGWRASSRRRGSIVPKPDGRRRRRRGDRHHRLRHEPLGDRGEPRPAARGDGHQDGVSAAARLSVHGRARRLHRRATIASTSSSRTATRRCCSLLRMELDAERDRASCAACCTTTGCRSTRESSPTRSWRRRGVGRPVHARPRRSSTGSAHRISEPMDTAHRRRRQEDEPHRPRAAAVPRQQDDAVRRLRAQRDLGAHHRRVLRDGRRSAARVIKLSGIGCSSKSPAYFLDPSHGFNSVHGRMPSVATGAMLANKKLIAIGVSGDGDTGAIGIGQFVHLMRRNLPLIYIIEDNGCYGLTKGQFSPTADLGSTPKNGVVNDLPPIDTCALAIELGASFVARSFSGDKKQLLSILKAAMSHRGTCDDRRHLAVRHVQRSRGLDEELRLREGSRRAARRNQLRPVSSRTSTSSTSRARRPP